MPTPISGRRVARSLVTPSGGSAPVTRVLDFNFASDQGIEITAVLGSLLAVDLSPAASDTVPAQIHASQTLHQEQGTLEDVPFADGEDADEIDTEVFFQQEVGSQFQVPATAGGGGGAGASGTLYLPYIEPILIARNITHRGQDNSGGQTASGWVLIYYRYVRFSDDELIGILSRRQ